MDITSIDHLDGLSPAKLRSITAAIKVKAATLDQLKKSGGAPGLTLDEYNETLETREEEECPKCEGMGVIKPPKPREVGVIHPSSAYKCTLRLYHDVTGEIQPRDFIPPKLAFTFAIGHAIHDVIQDALAKVYGDDFVAEAKIDIAGLIRGNTDGIIFITLPDGTRVKVILEIKTAGPSTYDGLRSPLKEHRIQAAGLYATGSDAPFIVYLYVSKVWPHPIKEFVEVYDPGIFHGWWSRKGSKVEQALKDRDAGARWPEPIADAKPSECGDCPYEHGCSASLAKKRNSFAKIQKRK